MTYIELYEALKKDMSEESARLIAEGIARGSELATRADIERLEVATRSDIERLEVATRSDIERLEAATRADIERLDSRIGRLEVRIERLDSDLSGKILRYFVPLWVAVFGALATMIGLVVVRGA